ncbi:hypothetical protein A3J41_01995 [candidate division TM6 bacterium RIFCSPHIGHO2_12_FULL_38_8]|nr:MAG: hypothetical protein A3J41_01995 [candidate division TM6 bacterium RIFCSPHIGHO2_12_FULL_38_8]
MANLLLDRGANPSIALIHAAGAYEERRGDTLRKINFFLERGANPNFQDSNGNTALMQSGNRPEIAKLLLEKKADPDIRDNEGRTALFYAHYNPEIAQMLMNRSTQRTLEDLVL